DDCPLKTSIKEGETKELITRGVAGGKTFRITHTGIRLQDGEKAVLEMFEDISDNESFSKETK
ncbi:MAG: hypothetical protein ABIH34_05330, partial [Nanoarchaeota archaeon]